MKTIQTCYRQKINVKALLMVFAMIVLSISIFPYVIANRGGDAFDQPAEQAAVEMLIVEGASYYLQSQADFMTYLNRVEMSELKGMNYDELRELLAQAIINMEQAKDAYSRLIKKAGIIPYKKSSIERLTAFDYDGFRRECELNPDIFAKVRGLLSAGHVRGVFHRMWIKSGAILVKMNQLKQDVDARRFPDLKRTWRLNELFLETRLFGQYAAQVFYRAFGNNN